MQAVTRNLKAQEPWIGSRGRFGVVIPSTNIAVEYDCQQLVLPGVSWHFGRFFVAQTDISSDAKALAFIDSIHQTIPDAVRDVLTCEPSYIVMGISAETFWGGVAGHAEFEAKLRGAIGTLGMSNGAGALDAALKAVEAKRVAAITPYQSVGDAQVRKFLEESGYTVTKVIGLRCDSATSIAHTPPREVIETVIDQLDADDVDAIVQAGTNLSTLDIFPTLEKQLGKPLIGVNVATIWHALRAHGIDDKVFGRGLLLEKF